MKIFDGNNGVVVRLITEEGVQEMKAAQAYEMADKAELDLILLSEKDGIPIVKIGDYKKLMFDQKKKSKENTKKQRSARAELKEIRLNSVIAEHDMEIKAKNIDRILGDGDRVIINIRFKGRAVKNVATGKDKIEKLLEFVSVGYQVIKEPITEGNRVSMMIGPKKK